MLCRLLQQRLHVPGWLPRRLVTMLLCWQQPRSSLKQPKQQQLQMQQVSPALIL
jgi:hypothetical protein